jgi:hypothetical protein
MPDVCLMYARIFVNSSCILCSGKVRRCDCRWGADASNFTDTMPQCHNRDALNLKSPQSIDPVTAQTSSIHHASHQPLQPPAVACGDRGTQKPLPPAARPAASGPQREARSSTAHQSHVEEHTPAGSPAARPHPLRWAGHGHHRASLECPATSRACTDTPSMPPLPQTWT